MHHYSLEESSPAIAISLLALFAGSAYVMYHKIKNPDIHFSAFSELLNRLKDTPPDSSRDDSTDKINDNSGDNNDAKIKKFTENHAAITITNFLRQISAEKTLDSSMVVVE